MIRDGQRFGQIGRFLVTISSLMVALAAYGDLKVPVNTGESTVTPGREKQHAVEQGMLRDEDRIPIATGDSVTVPRGGSITIELKTQNDPPTQLIYYVLRDLPKAGMVTPPIRMENSGGNTMSVVYTARPDAEATEDEFKIAAQYPKGRVSAPAIIKVKIEDARPVLTMPSTVVFPRVPIGSASTRTIQVTNVGNAVYQDIPDLTTPWSWIPDTEEETVFRLEPGQTRSMTIGFQPSHLGTTVYRFEPTTSDLEDTQTETRFIGEAHQPFDLKLEALELVLDDKSGHRLAYLDLHSIGQPITVKIGTDQRLQADLEGDSLTLGANTDVSIPIFLPKSDPHAYEGIVEISTPGWRREVSVAAEAVPARIEVASLEGGAAQLDFGSVPVGMSVGRLFQVHNYGGVPAEVRARTSGPWRFVDSEALQVSPASRKAVRVDFAPTEEGIFRERLQLSVGDQSRFVTVTGRTPGASEEEATAELQTSEASDMADMEFTMTPSVTRPPALPERDSSGGQIGSSMRPPASTSRATPGSSGQVGRPSSSGQSYGEMIQEGRRQERAALPSGPVDLVAEMNSILQEEVPYITPAVNNLLALPPILSRDGKLAHSPFREKTDITLPVIEEFGITNRAANSLELIWKMPEGHEKFEVELRVPFYNQAKERYDTMWVPWEKVRFQKRDGHMFATLKGLKPEAYYFLRVLTLGKDGASSLPSPEGGIATIKRQMDQTWVTIGVLLTLGVFAGGGGYLYWRYSS